MDSIEQTIQVQFRYAVHFTRGLFEPENPLLRRTLGDGRNGRAKVLLVVDNGVCEATPGFLNAGHDYCEQHSDAIQLTGDPIICAGGEAAKNTACYVRAIQEAVHRFGICRQSYILAVGGGAVLDMAGFAAATSHRGVRLIRIPTTVLSQNDSGVGVKNGINDFGKKNFLGTFAPPAAVLNDFLFLETLSSRDWKSGISEAVKVALIKDPKFFDFIERSAPRFVTRDAEPMEHLIRRCAELHLAHIAQNGDPFELGSSRPLDFGHWAAHKLEQLTDFGLRHGEAVAIGLALDCTYSWLSGFLSRWEWQRIIGLLRALDLPIYAPELSEHIDDESHPRCVLRGLTEFREHLGGHLTILLLKAIGKPFEVHEVSSATIIQSARVLKGIQEGEGEMAEALTASASKGD